MGKPKLSLSLKLQKTGMEDTSADLEAGQRDFASQSQLKMQMTFGDPAVKIKDRSPAIRSLDNSPHNKSIKEEKPVKHTQVKVRRTSSSFSTQTAANNLSDIKSVQGGHKHNHSIKTDALGSLAVIKEAEEELA